MSDDASETILVCEDYDSPADVRRRIVLNFTRRTATFENCHESRAFLSLGSEAIRECRFDELLAVHDFFLGERRLGLLRGVLAAGPLVHSHTTGREMESIIISTAQGRCRVFADWDGFVELREALRKICSASPGGHWSDDPRLIPVYFVVIAAIVAGIIWLLL